MAQEDPVVVVNAWVKAVNARDEDGLLALSEPDIEIVGPRGSGHGHQLLREWIERAGLTMEPLRVFVRGQTVVIEQQATWRALDTGAVMGNRRIASALQVEGGRVRRFARHDDLAHALRATGLSASDETLAATAQ
jgi:SnoaL-like domain